MFIRKLHHGFIIVSGAFLTYECKSLPEMPHVYRTSHLEKRQRKTTHSNKMPYKKNHIIEVINHRIIMIDECFIDNLINYYWKLCNLNFRVLHAGPANMRWIVLSDDGVDFVVCVFFS